MTAPTRTTSPHRAKALDYLRSGRVMIRAVDYRNPHLPPTGVIADVTPADYPWANTSPVRVTLDQIRWVCGAHPFDDGCPHRLAVQMVTGHGALGGAA